MKHILAFGDSNTWGLIPGTKERYPYEKRWTGIIDSRLDGVRIIEEGLCGRTTVFEDELRPGRKGADLFPIILESQSPIDGLIIMLGTNDCKAINNATSYTIGKGIERCLNIASIYLPADKILLMSPIHLGENVWRPDKDPEFNKESVKVSKELKSVYKEIAERRGHKFLAASDYARAGEADEEHLDEEGHRMLAEAILGLRDVKSGNIFSF